MSYPYSSVESSQGASIPNNIARDNPEAPLSQSWGEFARSFSATMYLMWTPTASSACPSNNGNICTIPIPLGSVNQNLPWNFSGDAINTLSTIASGISGTTTTWRLNYNGQPPTPAFQAILPNTNPNQSFPAWGSPSPYLGTQQCP
jgi:hypothetical protein